MQNYVVFEFCAYTDFTLKSYIILLPLRFMFYTIHPSLANDGLPNNILTDFLYCIIIHIYIYIYRKSSSLPVTRTGWAPCLTCSTTSASVNTAETVWPTEKYTRCYRNCTTTRTDNS